MVRAVHLPALLKMMTSTIQEMLLETSVQESQILLLPLVLLITLFGTTGGQPQLLHSMQHLLPSLALLQQTFNRLRIR